MLFFELACAAACGASLMLLYYDIRGAFRKEPTPQQVAEANRIIQENRYIFWHYVRFFGTFLVLGLWGLHSVGTLKEATREYGHLTPKRLKTSYKDLLTNILRDQADKPFY